MTNPIPRALLGAALVLAWVNASASTYPQQAISSFSPAQGSAGTVISVTGSGFTGSNAAWIGSAHDAAIKVISDTSIQVTIPADAITGPIGILNPDHASFSATSLTVTSPGSAGYPQPVIGSFSPPAGPAGTVVTLTGSGFTGANAAWIGSAHDATVKVISDTSVQVTIPADAITGPIGILNPDHASFSATSLTVTSQGTDHYPQPAISSFSPLSGPVGTVVTLTGSGFTGANAAWVGTAHDAVPKVLSDTKLILTVPADAQSGGITILNPRHSGVSSVSFTVSGGSSGGGSSSVRVSGNHLIDSNGKALQLRGANYSGFEFTAIQGWDPGDPSGAQAGQTGGPNWTALSSWKGNVVRLPLNEASWLGYTCSDSSGVQHNPDPGGNYKSAVEAQVAQATKAGIYVILDLHWAAPGTTCPMLQTQMADNDHSLAFWTSVATTFRSNPAVLLELYNEPYLYGLTGSESDWSVLMQGGTLSYYPATDHNGHYINVNTTWAVASMQAMLDAVRAAGATNVVLVGGLSYCNDLSGWLAHMPTDSLGQLAASWHPYPPVQQVSSASVSLGGSGYKAGDTITLPKPNTVYAPAVLKVTSVGSNGNVMAVGVNAAGSYLQTSLPTAAVPQGSTTGAGKGASFTLSFVNQSSTWSMPANWPTVQAISARVPLIITETGEHNEPGTLGAPFLQKLLPFADANNWSVVGWAWDVWGNYDNVLITDASGSPSAGYGQVFHDWMTGTAWQ